MTAKSAKPTYLRAPRFSPHLRGATAAGQNSEMNGWKTGFIAASLVVLSAITASALDVECTDPDDVNHRFTVSGDRGTYTWNDHGIERTWGLKCNTQRGGSASCHRYEQYGENGKSVVIFHMLNDGILIEAGFRALLDVSTVSVTPGFICQTKDN